MSKVIYDKDGITLTEKELVDKLPAFPHTSDPDKLNAIIEFMKKFLIEEKIKARDNELL